MGRMSNGRLGSGGYRGRLRALPRVAVGRIRPKAWAIVQTATAAGLAWYVAHILLGHPRPFFAPIAAAVCLSDSNLLRGQRALQMIGGVTLGIGTGIGVHAILGPGAAAIGLVVLVALLIAVVVAQGFIAQGLMFFNQSAASAVLVIALPGSGSERLFDALIGGALALLFSIVIFPAAPLPLLAQATRTTCTTLSNILDHLDQLVSHSETPATEWTLDAAEHINQSLDSLTKARSTAREIVRFAPRRRSQRQAVAEADHRAGQLSQLAGAVLSLARATSAALSDKQLLPAGVGDAIHDLSTAVGRLASQGNDPGDEGDADRATRAGERAGHAAGSTTNANRTVLIGSLISLCADDVSRLAGTGARPPGVIR